MEYLYNCRGCEKPDEEYPDEGKTMFTQIEHHRWARADAYGIYTGLYCDKCYDDVNVYTYRKDEYFDEGYAGEQLYPDE